MAKEAKKRKAQLADSGAKKKEPLEQGQEAALALAAALVAKRDGISVEHAADKLTPLKKTPRKQETSGGEKKKRKTPLKDYSKTKAFQTVREALVTKACVELGALDPLQLDRIDEIMDLWCQRQMLRDDVRRRGPTVLDERGRESENRCISLGLQVSKQILELYKALGLVTEPAKPAQGKNETEEFEDDEL